MLGSLLGLLVNSAACFDLIVVEKRLGTILLLFELFIKSACAEVTILFLS
jgi:hypothetical protein